MSLQKRKGNNPTIIVSIILLSALMLLILVAVLMLSKSSILGKYNNPNIASSVVSGSIYDRNGRAMAVEIPTWHVYVDRTKSHESVNASSQIISLYTDVTPGTVIDKIEKSEDAIVEITMSKDADNVSSLIEQISENNLTDTVIIQKKSVREYPASFHSSLLVYQTEQAMKKSLTPRPGQNEFITYGSDVYLTMDLDIQYVLDIAVQEIRNSNKNAKIYAMLVNSSTGDILAMTTAPMFNMNTKGNKPNQNIAFTQEFKTEDGRTIRPHFIMEESAITDISNYKYAGEEINSKLGDSRYSVNVSIPKDNPRYELVIVCSDATDSSIFKKVLTVVTSGLAAQGKIN